VNVIAKNRIELQEKLTTIIDQHLGIAHKRKDEAEIQRRILKLMLKEEGAIAKPGQYVEYKGGHAKVIDYQLIDDSLVMICEPIGNYKHRGANRFVTIKPGDAKVAKDLKGMEKRFG